MKKKFLYVAVAMSILLAIYNLMKVEAVEYSDVHIASPFVMNYTSRVADVNFLDESGDVDNQTVTLQWITGYLDGISIVPTGTDTSYKVYLYDENSIELFSKTDCSTADSSYRYALSHSDGSGSYHVNFVGVPVVGECSLTIADANDASLTNLEVYIYYRDCRRK